MVYLAGVLLGNFIPFPLGELFLLTFSVAGLAFIWRGCRTTLLAALFVLAGVTNLTLHTAVVSPHDLRTVIGGNVEYVTLRGTLVETPYHRLYEQREDEPSRTLAQVQVSGLRHARGEWQPATGTVAVSTAGILAADYFAGRTIEVQGVLRPPPRPVAEGLFDYRAYLQHHEIYFQLAAKSPQDWRLIAAAGPEPLPLSDRFLAWAKNILGRGLPVEDEPLRLLWTMTLGWKAALTGEVSEPFMKSGTMHIFAISGLHIALIAGIFVAMLRVLRVSRGWCGLVVIPLIWFYTGVTGWQASAIRSTVMMSIVIAGWSLKRPSDLLNSLAAAALIILVWEPQQIFQASFQLSFFVVLSIALFTPVLDKIRRRWLQTDPLLPDKLRPRWQLWLREILFWVSASFTTSLAAWLGSIPLVALYFHLFTPVSLLANLIVVPLSGLALASNVASLMTGGWFPALAELFNHSGWFFMLLMIRVSEWSAQLPGAFVYVATPTALGIAAYYSVLIAVMSGVLRKPRWRVWAGGGLVLLCGLTAWRWQQERLATRMTVLPLGGGSAVYCDAPGRADDLLVDCGNEAAAERVMKPFLHAQGVNQLDRLLLTHGDLRSVGGTETMLAAFSVNQVVTSPVKFLSPVYRKIVGELERTPARWRRVGRGDTVGSWWVLHPLAADNFQLGDDNALVLAGKFEGVRVLLLSDLGRPGQNVLVERTADLRADILVTGLSVAGELLNEALLDAVRPRVVVIADSEFPATRRAKTELLEQLARRGIPVLSTRRTGAVTLTLREGLWELTAMDGTRVEGKAD